MPTYRFTGKGGQVWRFESERELSDSELAGLKPPDEPEAPPAPAAPQGSVAGGDLLTGAVGGLQRAGSAALEGLSEAFQIPRYLTSDPLARGASRLAGLDIPDVPGPDGRPRKVTAPELLEEGAMPARGRAPRPTTREYATGMLDAIPGVDFPTAARLAPVLETALPALRSVPGLNIAAGALGAGQLGDMDKAVAALRLRGGGKSRAADVIEFIEDLARVPSRMVFGAATDPMTAAGAASVGKALGAQTPQALARLSAVDRTLAGLGATMAGTGSLQETAEASKAASRGDLGGAATHGLGALLTAGFAGLGAAGATSAGEAVRSLRPSGGRKYLDDPTLPAAERAALVAEDAAALRAAAQESVGAARQALTDFGEVDPLQVTPLNQALEPKASRARAIEALRQAKREAAGVKDVEVAQAEAQGIAEGGRPEGAMTAEQEFERIPRDQSGAPDQAAVTDLRGRLMAKLYDGTLTADEVRVLLRLPETVATVEAASPGRAPARAVERTTLGADAMDDAAAGQLRSIREQIAQRIESGDRAAPQDAAAIGEIDAYLGNRMRLQTQAAAEAARVAVTEGSPEADSALAMRPAPGPELVVHGDAPVPPGHTRLYRGNPHYVTPEWVKNISDPERATGRWFTPDRKTAENYAQTADGDVVFVDVPDAELAKFQRGHPGPEEEIIVPREVANRALSLTRKTLAQPAVRAQLPRLARPERRYTSDLAEALDPTPGPPERAPEAEPFEVGRQRTVAGPEGPARPVAVTETRPGGELFALSPRAAEVAGVEAPIPAVRTRASQIRDVLEARAAASRQAVSRLDEAARARGEQARAAETAKAAELGDLPQRQAMERVLERGGTKILKPAQEHLAAIPNGGEEVAGRLRAAQFDEERIGGAFWGGVRGALEDVLPGNDRAQAILFQREVAPVLDGAVPIESVSPQAQRAAGSIRKLLDTFYAELDAAYKANDLTPPKREKSYLPRIKKGQSLPEIEAEARILAHKHGTSVEDAAYAISISPRARMTPDAILTELRKGEAVGAGGQVIASRADRLRRFEKERVPNQPLSDFRTDLGVLKEYGDIMSRRIAELRHFGRNAETLQGLISRMDDTPHERLGLNIGDKQFAQTLVDRVRGVLPMDLRQQAGSMARTVAGVQGLVMSPLQQPLSLAQIGTMSIQHPVAAARGIQSLLFDGLKRGDLKNPLALAKVVRHSWRRADIRAEEVGALTKQTSEQLAGFGIEEGQPGTAASKVAHLTEKAPWIGGVRVGGRRVLPGLVQADRALRIIGANVGEFVVPRMVAAAKKGNKSEQRALAYMGIDWQGYKGTPEDVAKGIKFFADETNYRPNILRLPPQASSPLGRFGFQFASFMHSHTRFMGFLVKNPQRAAAFAAIGLPLAHLSNQLRFMLRGTPYEDRPIEDVQEAIVAAQQGKIRPDWTRGTKEALVAAGHAAATLGLGAVYQSMLERTDNGKITDLIPIARTVERSIWRPATAGIDAAGAIVREKLESDPSERARLADEKQKALDKLQKEVGKGAVSALPQVPLPGIAGSPNEVLRELTSDRKPGTPGWFGRLRDIGEELRAVPVKDETTRGPKGREAIRRLEELAARKAKLSGQSAARVADKPQVTVGEKLKATEKAALREQYRLAIIEAMAAGDHVEVLRLRQEARKLKLKFGRRYVRGLESRVYTPRDEQELEEAVP